MSSVAPQVRIPEECSSEQLFKDASEVVKLSTDLAAHEDKFDRLYFQYYNESPAGTTDKAREMFALNQIKEHHAGLWTEIDTTRARMRGLTLKASIVNSASRIVGVESGSSLH